MDHQQLALYREASQLAHALRDFCETAQPKLSDMSEDELLECVSDYTDRLQALKALNDQIEDLNRQFSCSAGDLSEYEPLRLAVREDLSAIPIFEDICRDILTQRQKELASSLMKTQKRRRLSAYLQSPMIGEGPIHYEKRD